MLAFCGLSVLLASILMQNSAEATAISAFAIKITDEKLPLPFRAIKVNNAVDQRYIAWPTPSAIPYRLDGNYSASEQSMIVNAMNTITTQMPNQCIKFVRMADNVTPTQDFIFFSPFVAAPITNQTCFSFPGRVFNQISKGQKLGLTSGVDGCLGSLRETMKFIVNALGLRNEYRRPDRDLFISVNTNNIKPELSALGLTTLYSLFGASPIQILTQPFDYNSITMPNQAKYVNGGTLLYTVINSGQQVANLQSQAVLSLADCQGLSFIYQSGGCVAANCPNPYGQNSQLIVSTTLQPGFTQFTNNPGIIGPPLEPPGGIPPLA